MSSDSKKYSIGQRIRSYDFPGINRKHCYIEGEIIDIDYSTPEQPLLVVMCTFDSLLTGDNTRVGVEHIVPAVQEIDKLWEYDRIEILK